MTVQDMARGGVICAAMLAFPLMAPAQGTDIGKQIYDTYCAVCHNTDGKGSGPFAGELTQKVPDLTMLQKNNNGMFPFGKIYDTIDGRQVLAAHGTREMPIWGNYFNEKGMAAGPEGTEQDYAVYVMGRVMAVAEYIRSLQVE